jgi:hypothetical protein
VEEEMSERRVFFTSHQTARQRAADYILREAGEGDKVTVEPKKRTDDQNSRFHWLCGLLAKSQLTWAGKRRTLAQWKVLMVSGHATATAEGSEMVPGIEGEFVNLRESTALMSVRRSTSLIEYTQAFMVLKGLEIPVFDEVPA